MDNKPFLFRTLSLDLSDKRIEILDGEEHLVIPVVAVVEGVLNGALLPIASIEASLPAWEGVPVTLSHPKQYGNDISANTKFAVENFVVGRFFNANVDGDKFKGEFWIKLSALDGKDDGDVFLSKVENNEVIEVSTAYWCQVNETGGIYKGKSYSGIQYNLVPNHVAILVNEVGACSVVDGCGAPRVNQEVSVDPKKDSLQVNCDDKKRSFLNKIKDKLGQAVLDTLRGLDTNRISFGQIEMKLREAISMNERTDTFIWVIDVYDDQVIYGVEKPNGEVDLLSRNYSIGSSPGYDINLDDPVEVERVVSYEPVKNQDTSEEEDMDRDKLIERLATNDAVPFSREQLTAMKDAELAFLASNMDVEEEVVDPVVPATPPATPAASDPATPPAADTPADPAMATNKLNDGVIEALNALGKDGITQVINASKALQDKQKQDYNAVVSRLVANERCTIPEATLRTMNYDALQQIERMALGTNYAGAGGPVYMPLMGNADKAGPGPAPSCILAEKAN